MPHATSTPLISASPPSALPLVQLLPRRYDYSRPVPKPYGGSIAAANDIETSEGSRECVICMAQVCWG